MLVGIYKNRTPRKSGLCRLEDTSRPWLNYIMTLQKFKKRLLEDKKFREEYYKKDLAVEIGEAIIGVRIKLGLTQAEFAHHIGIRKSYLARIENGDGVS